MRGIAHHNAETLLLKVRDLWKELCSIKNLELAYKNARKNKTLRPCVLEFEEKLAENLDMLRTELLFHSYKPKPLKTFILRDPKTRKISKSDFRDRVIHHALCNIIEPFFEKMFVHDSYANRKGKGTLKAIQRFEHFRKKLSQNNTSQVFILKSDLRHYFDEVNHSILLKIIGKRINDPKVLWLIRRVVIFSGNFKARIDHLNKHYHLTQEFDDALYSFDVGCSKGDIHFYEHLVKKIEKHGVKLEESLFIDDHQTFLDKAKSLGIQTLLFKSPEKLEKDLKALHLSF